MQKLMQTASTGESLAQAFDRLREQSVLAYNRSEGKLTGYDCPKCRNRGDFEEIRNGDVVRVPCKCQKVRHTLHLLEESGLADVVREMTFDRYQTSEEWQKVRKDKARQYLQEDSGKWFAMLGVTGSGKTHLCTAICAEMLRRGRAVRYIEWTHFAQELERLYYKPDEFAACYDPVRNAEVLYIDDFLKHTTGERAWGFAFDIIDHRAKAGLVTIISGERELAEIATVDTAMAGRIVEACGGYLFQNGSDQKRNWRVKR